MIQLGVMVRKRKKEITEWSAGVTIIITKQLLSTTYIPDIMLGALPSIILILQIEEIEV